MNETTWQRSSLQPFEFFLLLILIGVVVALRAGVFGVSLWGLFVIFVVIVGAASAVSLAPI
jgi:hypothetical protein